MQQRIWMAALVAVMLCGMAFATEKISDPRAQWVGTWKSTADMKGGPDGKPMHVTSELKCNWTPEHGAVICEQEINAGDQVQHQITVYTRDEKSGAYYFTSMDYGGDPAHVGRLEITGNTWTYKSLKEDANGPEYETVNVFKSANEVDFKVMRSTDHRTWETLGSGKTLRVR